MQQLHTRNKRISNIIWNWCYMVWFSPEVVFSANGSIHTSSGHNEHIFQPFLMTVGVSA